ncbi:MAG: YlmH/Sll1252 family protein [bacterium]|nr:YlmH/Sll1252 family protein [bacterium]
MYNDDVDITLFEIESKTLLTHSQILGSLFSHNLDDSMFGDIVITNDKYYIAVVNKLKNYFINNFNMVGKNKIKLHEVSLDQVKDFIPKYKELKISISSLRVDNVISKVIPTSRTISKELIDNDKVFINYEVLNNKNYSLKENDIFSIRGVGKFKLVNIRDLTKNNKYQIVIKKYI